jgi:kynurenine formamidase
MKEFRDHAQRVRNWGRWGADDELGTLNHISPGKVQSAATLVRTGKLFSLGVNFDLNGPQSTAVPFRFNPMHFVSVAGDYAQQGPFIREMSDPRAKMIAGLFDSGLLRVNDDVVVMPLQAATQWDALSHVYYDEKMYNGFPPSCVTHYGAAHLGIERVAPKGIVSRGVLVDVPRYRGVEWIGPGDPSVEPEELDDIARAQGVEIATGDILVVRTGWWERFAETRDTALVNNGLSWRCAAWLYEHEIAAVAADNVNVEGDSIQVEGVFLALHCLCLRDMGLMFGELWNLASLAADCAEDGVYDFLLSAPPIRVTGGIGSPLNPVALK